MDCEEFWSAIRDIYMDRVGDLVGLEASGTCPADNWNAFNLANCCRIPESAMPTFLATLCQLLVHPTSYFAASRVYEPMVATDSIYRHPSSPFITGCIRTIYDKSDEPSAYSLDIKRAMVLTLDAISARCRLVNVFTTIPGNYTAGYPRISVLWNYIRILLIHLEVFKVHCPLDTDETLSLPGFDLRSTWDNLWAASAASLQRFAGESGPEPQEQCQLALEAFALLDQFEGRIQQAMNSISQSPDLDVNADKAVSVSRAENVSRVTFPDGLYAALIAFVPEGDAIELAGFRYIQNRLPASHRRPSPLAIVITCAPEESGKNLTTEHARGAQICDEGGDGVCAKLR